AQGVEDGAKAFGDRFQVSAQEHLETLGKFLAKNESEWQVRIARVVEELLLSAKKPISENLVPRIEDLAERLSKSSGQLAEAGEKFNRYHQAWMTSQDEHLGSWDEASRKVESASSSLGKSGDHLRQVTGALEVSARALGEVAEIHQTFEEKLRRSLEQAMEGYCEELRSLVAQMRERSDRYDETLETLSGTLGDVITNLSSAYAPAPENGH
ncbi:MAG: hypothetical protein KDD47_15740, partial [Acidobacteria bacterium]|nr:hypothetical protein [Acidobacteriota bacterium]